jgi:peptidoglycan-N-acetylglucosamine deacetylase
MNILTFDIEDWYNCDFITEDFNWDKYECRIYENVRRLLDELDSRQQRGTFFCLGWLAEKHPTIIKEIADRGHEIGCHSYQHELTFRFTPTQFIKDTLKAKRLIEKVIGKQVNIFRAPGFSITEKNTWAIDCLVKMGFEYDCSVFPAEHDYGGMPIYGKAEPAIIRTKKGHEIKEFPINTHKLYGKNIVFSGGGFFRFLPYWLIRRWGEKTDYMMTYFHPRDFDKGQPIIKSLPFKRRFKSYVGVKGAFSKFQKLLDDFDFVTIKEADSRINWSAMRTIKL